ncbi:ABC transporter ATP-binding protein [Corynebacterium macclintockiae]|uniref:ABC transporter ATP-binding protein n=1 Tax=Corynebacterium macclintockiae TaxID=2913501 RepID=UPI003EB90AF7
MVLHVDSLGFRHGLREDWLFRGINLTLKPGELVWLRGASGSGKSTLLSIVSLLRSPTEGSLTLGGETFSKKTSERKRSAMRAKYIGLILQDSDLVDSLTVNENLQLSSTVSRHLSDQSTRMAVLNELGVQQLSDAFPTEISGGQRQRCAVARALIKDPKLILADEPTSALDPENRNRVLTLIQSYCIQNGAAAIIASHDAATQDVATRILDL